MRQVINVLAMTLLVIFLVVNSVIMWAEVDLESSITMVGLKIPQGRYKIFCSWGRIFVEKEIVSTGDPMNLTVAFNATNIRSPLKVSLMDPNGTTLIEAEMNPIISGYKLSKIALVNADVKGFEISETLSMVSIKIKLFTDTEPRDLNLKVQEERVTPILRKGANEVIVVLPPVVIDPGTDLLIDLQASEPRIIRFKGSILLAGDRLIASGSLEGELSGALMEIEHIYGLALLRIEVPSQGPTFEKEVGKSLTEIVIRRGLPEDSKARLIIKVRDSEGTPIPGAEIRYYSNGSLRMIDTDGRGVAVIDVDTQGDLVLLRISKPGYKSLERELKLTSGLANVEIVLDKEKNLLDELRNNLTSIVNIVKPWREVLVILGALTLAAGLVRLQKIMSFIGIVMLTLGLTTYLIVR